MAVDQSDDETWVDGTPPGAIRWLISCDESGVHGAPYYGFGSIWMGWQRRGDFSKAIQNLRDKHGHVHELKWNKTNSTRYQAPYPEESGPNCLRPADPRLRHNCRLVTQSSLPIMNWLLSHASELVKAKSP